MQRMQIHKTFILFYRKKLKMFANSFNPRMTYIRNFLLIQIFTKFCMSFGLNMNFAEKLIKIFIQSPTCSVECANKLWNSQILLVLHRLFVQYSNTATATINIVRKIFFVFWPQFWSFVQVNGRYLSWDLIKWFRLLAFKVIAYN